MGDSFYQALSDAIAPFMEAGSDIGILDEKCAGLGPEKMHAAAETCMRGAERWWAALKMAQGKEKHVVGVAFNHLYASLARCFMPHIQQLQPLLVDRFCNAAVLMDALRDYTEADHLLYRKSIGVYVNCFLIGTPAVPLLLAHGQVAAAVAWSDTAVKTFDMVHHQVARGDSEDLCVGETFQMFASLAPALGFVSAGSALRRLLESVRECTWNSEGFARRWQKGGDTYGTVFGGVDMLRAQSNLLVIRAFGLEAAGVSEDTVRAFLASLADGNDLREWESLPHTQFCFVHSVSEPAAHVAERLGDDHSADLFAQHAIDNFAGYKLHYKHAIVASALGVRGRVASRAGNHHAALSFFEEAAAVAMEGGVPLLAVCAALDCAGEAGARLLDAPTHMMGRPREELLGELAEARGLGPQAYSSWSPSSA